jgi:hypothetical protein
MNTTVLRKHGHRYKVAPSGCWEWTGTVHYSGYGCFTYMKKKYPAHWIHMPPRPSGKEACHKCDNKKCINPNHLWWGTKSENSQDMVAKKRYNLASKRKHVHKMHERRPWPSGENNGAHRLTEKNVLDLVRRMKAGDQQRLLAKEFGVAESVVSRIKHGARWSSVTGISKRAPTEQNHPSGLSGEHNVVLDAIYSECLHGGKAT